MTSSDEPLSESSYLRPVIGAAGGTPARSHAGARFGQDSVEMTCRACGNDGVVHGEFHTDSEEIAYAGLDTFIEREYDEPEADD